MIEDASQKERKRLWKDIKHIKKNALYDANRLGKHGEDKEFWKKWE